MRWRRSRWAQGTTRELPPCDTSKRICQHGGILRSFAARLGFAGDDPDARLAWAIVALALGVYAAGFALFVPSVATNTDEASYVRQARMLLEGATVGSWVHPLSGETVHFRISAYPLGTALLMAPGVGVLGHPGAALTSCLCLLAAVGVTALWLRGEGRSPVFALLVLGFPASLVLGRMAMSSAPSLVLVALALWLFWRGLDPGRAAWRPWLASGCLAGASLAFRESNALPIAPFYLGALVRRERAAWALAAGGLLGTGVRLLTASAAFGDPFFYKASSAVFLRDALVQVLPLQLFGLLVLVPGGLVFALAYRGRRRPELVASVLLFCVFYAVYGYGATETEQWSRRLVLGLRFYLPLLPILAFASGEAAPRLALRWPRARPAIAVVLALWIGGVTVAAAGVHPLHHGFAADRAAMRDAIHRHAGRNAVLVTNLAATAKFLPWFASGFLPLDRSEVAGQVDTLLERHGGFLLVLLDRGDSALWRRNAEENAAFVAALGPRAAREFDRRFASGERLRIWRVSRPGP